MGILRKIAYATGNLTSSLTGNALSTWLQFYYVDVLRLRPEFMGVAWTLYGIWNTVNEPLSGQLSDATRTRWGRRIPWLLFGGLPLGIAFALLWTVPQSIVEDQLLLGAYLVGMLWLFDALFTVVILNYVSLFPEMYPKLEDRALVSTLRQIFGVVGLTLGVVAIRPLADWLGWGMMGVLYAIIATLMIYMTLLGAFETGNHERKPTLPVREAVRATLTNRSFVTYAIAMISKEFGVLLLTAGIPFYVKYVLRQSGGIPGIGLPAETVLLGATMITAALSLAVWASLAARFGTRTALMASMAACSLALTPFILANDFVGTLVGTATFGLGAGGIMVLQDIMLSDIIDEDETITGTRREGMYFGINGLVLKGGTIAQGAVLAAILAASGYKANLPVALQPAGVEAGVRLAVAVLPAFGFLICLALLFSYPLHGKRLAEIQARRTAMDGAR